MEFTEARANELRKTMRSEGWRLLKEWGEEQKRVYRKRIDKYIADPKTDDRTKSMIMLELSARARGIEMFLDKPEDVIKSLMSNQTGGNDGA